MAKAAAVVQKKKAAPKAAPVVDNSEPVEVYDEVLDMLKAKFENFETQRAKETDQAYFRRMIESIQELDEDEWAAEASQEAQDWNNAAVEAANDDEDIVAPEGFVSRAAKAAPPAKAAKAAPPAKAAAPAKKAKPAPEPEPEEDEDEEEEDEDEESEDEDEEEEVEATPAPKAKKGAAAPAPAAGKGSFGGKKAAPFQAKPNGVTYQLRKIITANPEMTAEQLKAAIIKKGFPDVSSSTVSTIRGDALSTLKAAEDAGWRRPKGS